MKEHKDISTMPEPRMREIAAGFERCAKLLHELSQRLDGYSDGRGNLGTYSGTAAAHARELANSMWQHAEATKAARPRAKAEG
jgi:hypothetical protein